MAPGAPRKLKKRTYPKGPQPLLVDHSGKSASSNSGILRKMRGLREEEDVSIEHEIEAILSSGTQDCNNKGSHDQNTESATLPENIVVHQTQTPEDAVTGSSDIQLTESHQTPITNTNGTEASETNKRGRGQTMGKGIMKMFAAYGKKMKINVDTSIGRPTNADESAKLASQIGVITRDVVRVPKRWKDVDEKNDLEPGFDHLKIHMDVDVDAPGVKQCLIERFKNSSRQKRHKLHKHFLEYATLEEAKLNKPNFCPDKDTWEVLCDFFASPKYKHISDVNKKNRAKLRRKHISGRKAFTVRRHEISKNELNGEPCDRIELYRRTHCSENGTWKSVEAKESWELMIKKRDQYIQEGNPKTDDEIVLEVLGHGSGYIKGLGYGPKPPSKRNTTWALNDQHLQQELQETREKLQDSESQVDELKTQVNEFQNEVTSLKDKMTQQSETVDKLRAYLESIGAKL